jgi:hypothetical protein
MVIAALLWWIGIGVALYQWWIGKDLLQAILWFCFVLVCGQLLIADSFRELKHGQNPHR